MTENTEKTLEIFQWVLSHKHELFSIHDFKVLLCMSKKFQALLARHAEAFIVGLAKRALTTGGKLSRYWFKHCVYPRLKDSLTEDQRHVIDQMLSETRNLIMNATCSQATKYWTLTKTGGNGWTVEDYIHTVPAIRKKQKAFCGSYSDCEMEQDVDLERVDTSKANDFRVVIEAGTYLGRRWDCGSNAEVKLVLYDAEGKQLAETAKKVLNADMPVVDRHQSCCVYKLALLRVADPEVVSRARKARLILWTKDAQFWAGNYAARFTDMFVRIVPLQYFSKPPA